MACLEKDRDALFDLATDPEERDNRIDDPALADIRDELTESLLHWMERTDDQAAPSTRLVLRYPGGEPAMADAYNPTKAARP